MLRLAICSTGVYATFLLWAVAQEALAASFDAPLVLQLTQSSLAALAAYAHLRATAQSPTLPFRREYVLVALSITLSPVFAFAALRHISYPAMVLAKSCKLVPTMLTHVVLYRRSFRPYKYAVVLAVTLGICVFMYQAPSPSPAPSRPSVGLLYLLANLLLDGFTNSTQDALFAADPSLTGQQMMFSLSLLSLLLSLALLVLPLVLPASLLLLFPASRSPSLPASLALLSSNPAILPALLQYGLTNALGQLFIFETLHHFGSLTLITLTLTRKLFTMLLSVLLYNHSLSPHQWAGTAIVFTAISFEALIKRSEIIAKQK